MKSLALDLIEYMKNNAEQESNIIELYKSIRDKLGSMELNNLPEQYQDFVEDAWEICYARTCTYLTEGYCAESDIFPRYLLIAVTPYELCCDVNNIIDERIDSVFDIDDAESLSSDAIEEVVERSTLENAKKICNDYIEYMKSEYDQDLEVYNNRGNPYIVKYGKITEIAHLDCEKIAEISETSGSDYFNIEFEWCLK